MLPCIDATARWASCGLVAWGSKRMRPSPLHKDLIVYQWKWWLGRWCNNYYLFSHYCINSLQTSLNHYALKGLCIPQNKVSLIILTSQRRPCKSLCHLTDSFQTDVCVLPKSIYWSPKPTGWWYSEWGLGEVTGFRGGHKGGALTVGLASSWKRHQSSRSPSHSDRERGRLSASHSASPCQEVSLPACWSCTSSLQSCGKFTAVVKATSLWCFVTDAWAKPPRGHSGSKIQTQSAWLHHIIKV